VPRYWYVIDVQTISIDSGWEQFADANDRAMAMIEEGRPPGSVKVMTKPRVGGQVLDPKDDRSWASRRGVGAVSNPRMNPGKKYTGSTLPRRGSGYTECACPDCFETTVSADMRAPEFCAECKEAGCAGEGECRRPAAYGVEENPRKSKWDEDGVQDAIKEVTRAATQYGMTPQNFRFRNDWFGWINDAITGPQKKRPFGTPDESGTVYPSDDKALLRRITNEVKKNLAGDTRGNPGELVVVNPSTKQRVVTETRVVRTVLRGPVRRKNPAGEPDTNGAEDVFRMWHQKEPRRAFVLNTGCRDNDTLVCVGPAVDIEYRSGKWQKGRKTEDYIHDFESRPKVWMLADRVEEAKSVGRKVGDVLSHVRGADGRFAVAELATPLRLGVEGPDGAFDLDIHAGARVYGAVDKKTVIVCDPVWLLIVIRGGKMFFDERGLIH
jgi:hypothetical protein